MDTTRVSTRAAQKPRGGQVFIYDYGEATTKGVITLTTFTSTAADLGALLSCHYNNYGRGVVVMQCDVGLFIYFRPIHC